MQVKTERPPVADRIKEVFDVEYDDGNIIVTYGNDIYTKGGHITNELFAHEVVHTLQQKEIGPVRWWLKYFVDSEFRLNSELEAYRNQYRYVLDAYKDRNERYRRLIHMATALSGKIYGNIIDREKAIKLIKQNG